MENEVKAGQTFTHNGTAYTVVSVVGANVIATNPDGAKCLIPINDVKGN